MPPPTNNLTNSWLKQSRNFLCYLESLTFVVATGALPVGKAVVREAGDDVEVGVKNNLAGYGLVVHFDVDAIGANRLFYGDGKFLHYDHHMSEGVVGNIVEIGRVDLGDDEGVADIYRVNV